MGDVIAWPEPEPLWREVVGRVLRAERRRQRRTLSDVAEWAGISLPYLSEIERGRKEPSSEVLGAVAGALGLHLADLTGRATLSLTSTPLGGVRSTSSASVPIAPLRPQGPLALAA